MSVDILITAYLKQKMGLDAGSVGASTVERAVRLRTAACALPDSARYWELLQGSTQEQQALIEAVVVPETWFFRYPESFQALATLALQRAGSLGRPLRLLSAPCSSGEEPYSMAMALLDAGLAPAQFSVDALDISQQVIARASTGVYGKNSFRGASLHFRERHFTQEGSGYSLGARVRSQVNLRTGNLLAPVLPTQEQAYDFVFCRNVLIYFDLPTQEAVLQTLLRLAQKDGYLFVGPAEANLLSQHGLRAIGIAQSFAFHAERLKPPAQPQLSPARPIRSTVPAPAPARRKTTAPRVLPPPPAATVVADEKLDTIAALANAGRLDEALRLCEQTLAQQGPSAPLFYWFGLLNDAASRATAAQEYYRKALYLDPQHRESLAHLAALLEARGDRAGAQRLQARAIRGAGKHD